jgi:FkbM family methyltransferase
MISYTRNFEDVMICRALKHIERGFYIDVGASHPVSDSNTFALYRSGWRGLVIEPQDIFNNDWLTYRAEDLLLNAAIGHSEGEMTLYKPTDYGQAATTNPDFAKSYVERGLAMAQTQVKVHTLTNVLLKARPQGDIHLLSVDVEGAERAVIEGLDWARFRPWLVVLESTFPGVPTPNYHEWEALLLSQGYEFAYFDAVNRFYVAKEHSDLKQHFDHPPCVWDGFESNEVVYLREQASQHATMQADLAAQTTLQITSHKNQLNEMSHWLFVCGKRLESSGDIEAFESVLWKIFELNPTYADIYWPLGALLCGQNRRAEALSFYQQAAMHTPLDFYSHHNIGMLMRWERRWEESEAAFRQMLVVKPDFSEGRMNFGALLLALGRYEEGWALFESRYLVFAHETPRMTHNAPFPRWTGESLAGKSIMVMREQGYGDEIMFARFTEQLKARGASNVTILCQPAIRTLLQTIPWIDQVVCEADLPEWPAHDYWCYGQSLPHALGTTLATLPATIPYLQAQPTAQKLWRARLEALDATRPAPTRKVGITWRGSPSHGNDSHRSLPSLATLRPLWDIQGIEFISVQTGEEGASARVA